MTRHDIPETVKNVINAAVKHNAIDMFDVYEMAVEFKDDFKGLVNELCEIGFAQHHFNPEANKSIVMAAEKYWQESL